MSFVYLAKVCPMDKDIALPGDRLPIVLREENIASFRERPWHVKIREDHDVLRKIGQCSDLSARNGWLFAEFVIDPSIERVYEVGKAVSVGLTQMREGRILLLQEISVVDRGAIPGAQIISRRELKQPVARPAARPVAPAAQKAVPPVYRATRSSSKDERELAELRRRLEVGGYENLERILTAYRLELGYDSPLSLIGRR